MHTWRGIGILVIFATIEEKENFLHPPCGRDAETHIRTRAAAGRATERQQKKISHFH